MFVVFEHFHVHGPAHNRVRVVVLDSASDAKRYAGDGIGRGYAEVIYGHAAEAVVVKTVDGALGRLRGSEGYGGNQAF